MDLSLYDIIVGPVVSDKAYKLNKSQKQLILKVHTEANKAMVKEALEKLFNVKVAKVNTMLRKGKVRRVRGRVVIGSIKKIAIITLVEGYKLDLFDQAGAHTVAADAATAKSAQR